MGSGARGPGSEHPGSPTRPAAVSLGTTPDSVLPLRQPRNREGATNMPKATRRNSRIAALIVASAIAGGVLAVAGVSLASIPVAARDDPRHHAGS
jgi:hypothetical protein